MNSFQSNKIFYKRIKKCYYIITKDLWQSISLETINNIYGEIRNIFNIVYQQRPLGEKDSNKNFSEDESIFYLDENKNQAWVLGEIDNVTKDYRLDVIYTRDKSILNTFITTYRVGKYYFM